MFKITSAQNPQLKAAKKLKDRKGRDSSGDFVIEGYRELSRAADVDVHALFVCPDLYLGSNEGALIDTLYKRGATVLELPEDLFRKLSFRDRPDGLFAIAKQPNKTLSDIKLSDNPFLLVAQGIEKPGNLGSILRSCDAVGVDGCVVVDRCTDIYNPNVVRASVGTLFTVPTVETNTAELFAYLKEHQISIVATTPDAQDEYTHVDLTGPVAIAVGTEQLGLSDEWLNAAEIKVRIPMRGQADSLNVASATTLMLYEVLRQRSL
ncbi:MAG: RNA methyltransferase [Chlamydiales bacterium]|nr:RNA methyltransferase [Chlamydiales bacterium]